MTEKISLRLALLLLFLQTSAVQAQEYQIEMADTMRSNGKIFVVITCAFLVLAVMTIYLFSIDKRISQLEKKHAKKI